MERATVVVIGGGATGLGILRDLSMRGVDTLLLEKRDLVNGASSRYHGLLHSGARYAVKDQEAAKECIIENNILRRIGKSCVEATEGLFVRLDTDEDPSYEAKWVEGCKASGINAIPIDVVEARRLEPHLSPHVVSAYRVPDAAIDGFRMSWQNVESAKRYGGRVKTYTEVIGINVESGVVKGVRVCDYLTKEEYDISCDMLINAAGPWSGFIAKMAGLDVHVQPDKGTLIVFNQRISSRVVNRLRKSSDGDIFVPHGSVTILGTSSMSIPDPEDTSTSLAEVEKLMRVGEEVFEHLRDYRILRVFAGSRPLYSASGGTGRGASRGFAIVDHEEHDGLKGMMTIAGGKFTTYRLMAEKMADQVCKKLQVSAPCRTAEEPLVPAVSEEQKKRAKKFFPSYGTNLAATRLGPEKFAKVLKKLETQPEMREVICECENVTLAELDEIAKEATSHSIGDVRRRTRLGMGTCQGNFCALHSACILAEHDNLLAHNEPLGQMKKFVQERYKGIRPVLWGRTLRETEMTRALYELTFNVNGRKPQ